MFLHHNPLHLIHKRRKAIILFGFLAGIITFLVSLFFPLEFRADTEALIISRSRFGVDPYTVVKSAERVGENIVQIMDTNDFFEKVFEQPGHRLDRAQFDSLSERKKRRLWERTIDGSVVYGTGVLRISVYHKNKNQALELAAAVGDTLVARGWEYVGGDVSIKIVNQPIVTNWPARPNLPLNALLGWLGGAFFMTLVVLSRGWR